jgi:hypothetical protein
MTQKIDVHQHLWTEPFVAALQARQEVPFVRRENGLAVLFIAGERPYVIDTDGERAAVRGALVASDGLDRALVCLSSPLGIESLPREQSRALLDAYHEGAHALGEPFGVWGAIALQRPDPDDVDRLLAQGCVGVSLPAGALASVDALARLQPLLTRLEQAGAPLLIHPGPGPHQGFAPARVVGEVSLDEPLWWPALTQYVFEMQAAWFAFLSAGRAEHSRLRVIFTMLAGLAPLQHERLLSRGGTLPLRPDPLTFYETSSYGPQAVRSLADVVGAAQLLYGSDRPVADPHEHGLPALLDWDAVCEGTRRALGERSPSRADSAAAAPVAALRSRQEVLGR